jgi:hypothetical protein
MPLSTGPGTIWQGGALAYSTLLPQFNIAWRSFAENLC